MLTSDPSLLGVVASVSGSAVSVFLGKSVASGLSIIDGKTYQVGQVGSFVKIPQGYQDLFGVISDVGAEAIPDGEAASTDSSGRWMRVHLVGEAIGGHFERGIGQYPNIGDNVHLAIESDLTRVYNSGKRGHVKVGSLSNAESISAKVAIDELVTRHSAILGSTGSGKSTTVASLLRSITLPDDPTQSYPSARILMLDLHGEYSRALGDIAQVFSVGAQGKEQELSIPYWALDTAELLDFLTGNLEGTRESAFTDRIFELKIESQRSQNFAGVDENSITVDTPLPFSLNQLWYDLVEPEVATFVGVDRNEPAKIEEGDPELLKPPVYRPHAMGNKGPFLNNAAPGVLRPLNLMRSKLLDRRYDFLLHPGAWEPDLTGKVERDLDALLAAWLGGPNPISILDLSRIPSNVLELLVGTILKIVYESLFWSREKTEGGKKRPLLVVMEEAHRYLSGANSGIATETVQRIAKEGRKYGIGAMIVSQRPSEIDETILSQCGTTVALRLTNPSDRSRVQGTLPDGLTSLLDLLPILRTGEAIIFGEAAKLPMRCRISLPPEDQRPDSEDPKVSSSWSLERRLEGYDRVVASWRAQNQFAVVNDLAMDREEVEDDSQPDEEVTDGTL